MNDDGGFPFTESMLSHSYQPIVTPDHAIDLLHHTEFTFSMNEIVIDDSHLNVFGDIYSTNFINMLKVRIITDKSTLYPYKDGIEPR